MPQALSSPHGYYAFVPYPHGTMEAAAAAVKQAIVAPPLVVAPPPAPAPAPAPAPLQAVVNIPNPQYRHWNPRCVAPTGPLAPVDEPVPAPEWYCITRGRFVGVIDQYAQAHYAICGVSNAANKAYSTQAIALNAFNQVVAWGGIESQILSNGSPMPPLSLFDIAALLSPDNPTPPPREQLERLTAHLSLADLQTVVQLLGLGDLARITTPLMPRVMAAAQSILDETPPAQDDELDHLIRDFDLASLQPRPHGPQTSRPASQPALSPLNGDSNRVYGDWLEAGSASQGVPGGAVRKVAPSPRSRSLPPAPTWSSSGIKLDALFNWPSCARARRRLSWSVPVWFPDLRARRAGTRTRPLKDGRRIRLECHLNIAAVKGGLHKSYASREAAESAFQSQFQLGQLVTLKP
ncbi:hypothetical protein DFH09DRAFT_1085980 [Mycena vulgaris]|nr:hypothetical protein DFH09DRAFT_1085980 [Mycena vulgaris]